MSVIKLSWYVDDLAAVMALYNTQKIYRSPDGESDWEEITGPSTRVALETGVVDYIYTDTNGSPFYYYSVAYFNTSTTAESDKSDPFKGEMAGYISIEDIRDEGFDEDDYSDERVEKAIIKASRQIDRVTRRFFEVREMTIKVDGDGDDWLKLRIPIIAALEVKVGDTEIKNEEIVVYNRHLTQGLTEPDDRRWPRIEFKNKADTRYFLGNFTEGQQNVTVRGYFGYTELGLGDPIGETEEGSQIPLSYGETPDLIKSACLLLAVQYIYRIVDGDADDFRKRLDVVRMKTRDQEIEYNKDTSESLDYGNLTGDPQVDRLLATFVAPNPIMSV